MENNERKIDGEKIRDIAERVKNSETRDSVRTTKSGATEYSFSAGLPETGLVFIDGEEEEEQVAASAEIDEESIVELSEELEEPELPRVREAGDEEFNIPDIFVVSEEYTEPSSFDMAPMIWKTYVPRFTEVTERTYKLRDENSKKPASAKLEQEIPRPSVKVDRVVGGESSDPTTAEIETEAKGAVIVNVDGEARERRDTINVFKFGKTERPPEVLPTEEELERRDITALTGHKWETDAKESELEPSEVPEAEPTPEEESVGDVPKSEELRERFVAREDDELPENERPFGWDIDPATQPQESGSEFNHHSKRESFKDRFLDKILAVRIRLVVSLVLVGISLAAECAGMLGYDVLVLLGLAAYPAAIAVLDGAFILAQFVLTLPETLRAARRIADGKVIPELFLSLSAISLIAYGTVCAANVPARYISFSFIYGILAVSAIYATHCLHSADFTAFKLVSDRTIKTVVDSRLTRTLERENIALDGAVDEYKSKTARAFKAGFVSGFVKNTGDTNENYKGNLLLLCLVLGIATVTGAVLFFIQGLVPASAAFSLVVMLAMPMFSVLSHKLPFYHSELEARERGAAFIGEASLYEYAACDCITFLDTDVFGRDDVSFKSISLSDRGGDLSSAMRRLSALFCAVGGPLEALFEASLGRTFAAADDVIIEDDGISGTLNGAAIMAGSAEYMKRHGVSVQAERDTYAKSTKVMYGAEDGVLFAKLNIQYNFSEEFALSLQQMREGGITPLVYTRDPNVSAELMRFLTGGADVIRVMKRSSTKPKRERIYPRLSSRLVIASETEALPLVLLAKRYLHTQSNVALTELSATAVGAALAAVIAVTGMISALPAVLIGVWQIAWCVVMAVVSRRSFSFKKKKKGKD